MINLLVDINVKSVLLFDNSKYVGRIRKSKGTLKVGFYNEDDGVLTVRVFDDCIDMYFNYITKVVLNDEDVSSIVYNFKEEDNSLEKLLVRGYLEKLLKGGDIIE